MKKWQKNEEGEEGRRRGEQTKCEGENVMEKDADLVTDSPVSNVLMTTAIPNVAI